MCNKDQGICISVMESSQAQESNENVNIPIEDVDKSSRSDVNLKQDYFGKASPELQSSSHVPNMLSNSNLSN